ncbi:glycosyltransferase family 4 protein [Paracrocinitomix mangrovi]|uniref:glycosyltransferase family 4 protein n=1 Tax=Paracrocinitomix mangrovi TaxID=2862509 RepID=UPI001C8F1122|nr:glycosyltransferase family 1 protein [Paracrocinitomix mangrovi]UKN02960.1 glycosyltransferase family 4 protein [Paracrocinitomix mangrovi]
MRIAINTRFLLKSKMEGFGWFTYETVKRIVIAHPEHEFYFFFDRKYDNSFIFAKNVTPVVLNPPTRTAVLIKYWFNISVPKALKKYKIDLFFSPDGFLSLKTDIPQIGVMHDLNFEHYPNDLPGKYLRFYKKYFPQFAEKAIHLLTVSKYSKQDIIEQYDINPDKITVAYNGANDAFKPLSTEEVQSVKQKYSSGVDYFVFVGALHARKNVPRLFEAFDLYKKNSQSDFKLIVVGEKLWKDEALENAYSKMQFKGDVIFTGHLSLDELTKVVASAKSLVFPSYFEGFGIPVVEAMKAGCPVICSNKTSLPEVAGDAAILFDPFSVEDMANAMNEIDANEILRTELIAKGTEQAKKFNWDKTAEKVWESISMCLHAKF